LQIRSFTGKSGVAYLVSEHCGAFNVFQEVEAKEAAVNVGVLRLVTHGRCGKLYGKTDGHDEVKNYRLL